MARRMASKPMSLHSHHGTAGSSADRRGSSTRRQKEPHAERSRPVSSLSQRSLIHLGMDVHKDSISIGILRPDDSIDVERIFHDEESVRRFIARMGEPRQLTACYEAGPTGSGL